MSNDSRMVYRTERDEWRDRALAAEAQLAALEPVETVRTAPFGETERLHDSEIGFLVRLGRDHEK